MVFSNFLIQIIVYAGAVLVLYLFVLFLVSLREELHLDAFVPRAWIGRIIAIGLALALLRIVPAFTLGPQEALTSQAIKAVTNAKALGLELFSTFLLPFELAGLILLVALLGGLVLARREEDADEWIMADTDKEVR